jgi:hypothetical protein
MTEPAAEIELLRAERDELRADLLRTRGAIAWVMSDIYPQRHFDPDFLDNFLNGLIRASSVGCVRQLAGNLTTARAGTRLSGSRNNGGRASCLNLLGPDRL